MKVIMQKDGISVELDGNQRRIDRYKQLGYVIVREEKVDTVDDIVARKVEEALKAAGVKPVEIKPAEDTKAGTDAGNSKETKNKK